MKLFKVGSLADRQVLKRLRSSLEPVLHETRPAIVIRKASKALELMTKEADIGPAIATRLLALARPDVCVSVNNGSLPTLGSLTNLPVTVSSYKDPRNYERLLNWVAKQPWSQPPEPIDPWGGYLWSMRAALIDCFVYKPI